MCFSPEVDVVAGITIAAIGVDTVRQVELPRQRAIAALPLIFGIHQISESFVWWGLDGRIATPIGSLFTGVYLALAFGLLPWFVPWATRRLELDPTRRAAMAALVVVGASVSAILTWAVVAAPVAVVDGGHYLSYRPQLTMGGYLAAAYVVTTCGALLLSSDRYLVLFGAVNLLAVSVLALFLMSGVISLWCAWAAVTSASILWYLRRTNQLRARLEPIGTVT